MSWGHATSPDLVTWADSPWRSRPPTTSWCSRARSWSTTTTRRASAPAGSRRWWPSTRACTATARGSRPTPRPSRWPTPPTAAPPGGATRGTRCCAWASRRPAASGTRRCSGTSRAATGSWLRWWPRRRWSSCSAPTTWSRAAHLSDVEGVAEGGATGRCPTCSRWRSTARAATSAGCWSSASTAATWPRTRARSTSSASSTARPSGPDDAPAPVDHGADFYAAGTWNDAPDGDRIGIAWMANWAYAARCPRPRGGAR